MTRLVLLTAAVAVLTACDNPADTVPEVAAAAAPGASAGDADRGPLQAGLWETSTVDATSGGAPDVVRVCIGEGDKGPAEDALPQFDECTVSRTNGPAGETTHAECMKDGVTFVTDATMAARPTTYTFTLTTRATMPGGGVHESRISANGRRLGPCPAGMARP